MSVTKDKNKSDSSVLYALWVYNREDTDLAMQENSDIAELMTDCEEIEELRKSIVEISSPDVRFFMST